KTRTSASSLNWSMAASLNSMSLPDVPSVMATSCRGVPDNSTTGQRHDSRDRCPDPADRQGDDGYVIERDWSHVENLWSLVERASRRYGDRPFIEPIDGSPTLLTFSQLAGAVEAVAGFL